MADNNLEEESAEILLAMKNNSDTKPGTGRRHRSTSGSGRRSQKRRFSPESAASYNLRERDQGIKAKKYLGDEWENTHPVAEEEVEVESSEIAAIEEPPPRVTRSSARVKEQHAQLPKQLKDCLKRLKNLLKLPKARRWVYCEFFFSDLDRELLQGEYEFRQCLRESFPNLKTRQLRRAEWRQIRRLIGKPRRCSQAFFDEERQVLDAKRYRIRDIHKGAALTLDSDVDIPPKIPQPLVVGAKVFARVRFPKDGIFTGTVDAVMDGRYRIIFDKDVVMPLIVSDFEIMSETAEDLVPVSFFLEKNKAAQPLAFRNSFLMTPAKFLASTEGSPLLIENDPLLTAVNTRAQVAQQSIVASGAPGSTAPIQPREERCGNYPLRLVVMMVKLSKLIETKKTLIAQLQDMNGEAERMHLYAENYLQEFQEQYAKTLVELEQVNKQIEAYLTGISEYFGSLLPHLTEVTVTSRPEALHKLCHTHAVQIVKHANQQMSAQNRKILDLVTSLTALLLQVRALGQQQCNAYELHTLRESIEDIKNQLDQSNHAAFEDNVEVHLKHIEFTMQGGDVATLSSNLLDV